MSWTDASSVMIGVRGWTSGSWSSWFGLEGLYTHSNLPMALTILCIATYEKETSSCGSAGARAAGCCCSPRRSCATRTGPANRSTRSTIVRRDMPERDIRQGRRVPRPQRAARSHRGARRLRRRDGGDAARVPARSRAWARRRAAPSATSWRCDRGRAQRRHPLPRLHPRPEPRRPCASWIAHVAPAVGAETAIAGRGDRHQEDRVRRRALADASVRSTMSRPTTSSSSSCRAMSITSTRSSSIDAIVVRRRQPLRHVRRWRSRTRAASSSPGRWPTTIR